LPYLRFRKKALLSDLVEAARFLVVWFQKKTKSGVWWEPPRPSDRHGTAQSPAAIFRINLLGPKQNYPSNFQGGFYHMIFFEMIDKTEYGRDLRLAAIAGNQHDAQDNQGDNNGKDDFFMTQNIYLQSNNGHIILLSIFLCKTARGG